MNLILHINEEYWNKSRICAAYRKSYKLCGIINKGLIITGGILGSTAVLAVVPVIPVFVAAISVVPVIIGIITNATKLSDKKLSWNHIIENLRHY